MSSTNNEKNISEQDLDFALNVPAMKDSKKVIESYNSWAKTYDKTVCAVNYAGPRQGGEALAQFLKDNKHARILDVAAGTGLTAEAVMEFGFDNFDALDPAQEMLDVAKEKNIYQNFFCEYLGPNRLSMDSNTYDAVIGTGMFGCGHVGTDCLPELIRVIKKGGFLVIACRTAHIVENPKLCSFEADIVQFEKDKKWKMVERKLVEDYYNGLPGTVFTFQIL